MKRIKTSLLSITLILITFSSCKKDNTTTGGIIHQGTWKVTQYSSNGTDELSYFSGYELTFNDNGNAVAVKSSNSFSGSWNTGTDNSQDKLVLSFGTSPLDKLNNDWHIIEKTTTKFRLEDVSGGNGGTELLTLEKN